MTHLYLAGLGIRSVAQVTRETEAALRACRTVFYLDTGAATRIYLESLCPAAIDLYQDVYREGTPRLRAYQQAAIRVVEAALDGPPVAFALHGHPLIAAYPPLLALKMARALGLEARVLPGISSIDTICADLELDPVAHGIQMYEATDVLLRRRPLLADVPALLWQIGSIETALHTDRISSPDRFARLVRHLLRYYPAGHGVAAVYSAPHPLMPAHIIRCAIEALPDHAGEFHHGYTLYLPPAFGRPALDSEAAVRLLSAEHLAKVTR